MKICPLTTVLKHPHYKKGHDNNESERKVEVPPVKGGNRW